MKPSKIKVIPVIFIFIAIVLAGAFILTKFFFTKNTETTTRAKLVTPKSADSSPSDEVEHEKKLSALEAGKYETFIPLNSNETLINTLTIDFNNDGYEDEVILVRSLENRFLLIVPGIYNPENGNYERQNAITTAFTSTRAFSYSSMDVIGDHRNSIIYQGITDDGLYVMQIFLWEKKGHKKGELVNIGDFSCDGNIFIQQTERSESYELGVSKGESFSVWVYKTDIQDNNDTNQKNLNQIQQEYRWNAHKQHYELNQEIKVTAGRLAAKELSKIQDGTEETFGNFLNGLWYKTSNTDGNIRYIFFDYEKREIIQLVGEIQEIYEWEKSKVRHNGIYVTSVNADIMNLHRRFDVQLVNVDEIKISIRDDINLVIKESPLWDGQYKKMSIQNSFSDKASSSGPEEIAANLKGKKWAIADDSFHLVFDDYTYSIEFNGITETGIFNLTKIGVYNIIQFRSDLAASQIGECYSINYGTKTITETVKRRAVEKTVTDYNNIILTPVKITPTDCFTTEGKILNFTSD